MDDAYLTVRETADLLKVHVETVRTLIRTGKLKAKKNVVSGTVRVLRSSMDAYAGEVYRDWQRDPTRPRPPVRPRAPSNTTLEAKAGAVTRGPAAAPGGAVAAVPVKAPPAPPNETPPPPAAPPTKPPVTPMPKKDPEAKPEKTTPPAKAPPPPPPKKSWWDDEVED